MATSGAAFWDFKGIDEYNDRKLMISTPYAVIFILISYLWFVLKFGPDYMKNRAPFNLRNLLVAYNAMQVLITFATFAAGTQLIWRYGLWHTPCMTDKSIEIRQKVIDGSHYYFLTKIIELIDTVFFVLRKKQRQVTFLHVYHHTLMVIATWLIAKYSRNDTIIFLGTINSLVHVVMYSYYGLSAFPHLTKYLWWKKYITIMQLVQFVMMFLHVVICHNISECQPAYYLLSSVCANTIFFMYLFGDFYIKSYNMKKYNTKALVNASKIISSNIGGKNGINYIINHHKLASKMN